MIHVLHLSYAVSQGGAANVIVTLCNRLDPERFRASIITMTPNGGFEKLLADRITLRRVLATGGNDPRMILRLAQVIRELRPDVVNTHAWGTLCEGLLAAKLAGVPAVVHDEHGTLELRPFHRRVQRQIWGWLDQVVAVSDVLRDRMVAGIGFPRERIRVIRNGIDVDRATLDPAVRRTVRNQLGAGDEDLVIGTVGRLHPVKGQRFLIEALALLPPRTQLWLVGIGELRDELERLADSLSLSERVRFLGHRDDVPDLLAAVDIYCQPSLSEGISMALLEAGAAGRPVVATGVGGTLEVVVPDETGLLVDPGRPEALAAALKRLADRPEEARRLGEAARRRVVERYSWTGMVSEYEQLYTSIMARRRRPPRQP